MNGLRPIGRLDGSPIMGDTFEFLIDPTYATAIGQYDPVVLSSGYVTRSTGAASQVILGVLTGVKFADPTAPGGTRFANHWDGIARSASLKVFATIAGISDETIFSIPWTGTPAVANIGARFLITMGAVNALTGHSNATVGAADGNGPLKLLPLDINPVPGETSYGTAGTVTARVVKALSAY